MSVRVPATNRLKPPSWLDGRLLVGVLLVLVSVAVGAKVVASSDHYDLVWAATHDVAAGSVLTRADLQQVKVKFHDSSATAADGEYVTAGSATLVGRTSSQALFAGQLIPAGAVPVKVALPTRLVTVPVARLHMPKGATSGIQVDLYVTVGAAGGSGKAAPQLVLANVTVADTISDSSGLGDSGGSGVVLSVPIAEVSAVVAAAEAGTVDLVLVPAAQTQAAPSPGTFVASAVPASPEASPGA
jgi:hypothetical protein